MKTRKGGFGFGGPKTPRMKTGHDPAIPGQELCIVTENTSAYGGVCSHRAARNKHTFFSSLTKSMQSQANQLLYIRNHHDFVSTCCRRYFYTLNSTIIESQPTLLGLLRPPQTIPFGYTDGIFPPNSRCHLGGRYYRSRRGRTPWWSRGPGLRGPPFCQKKKDQGDIGNFCRKTGDFCMNLGRNVKKRVWKEAKSRYTQ